jgi:probable O-glycosylation ligase (exosortase A-associated)
MPVGDRRADVLSLRLGDLLTFWTGQSLAFWAMCGYLVIEYVRPQDLIGPLRGAPLGQIVLGVALLGFVLTGRWFRMINVASWLMLLFTGVIIASSVFAYDPATSFAALRTWLSWVVIFFLIANVVNTKQRLAFFTVVWLLCHSYMAQGGTRQFAMRGFHFATWGVLGAPGWFKNSGEFAIAMCMYTVVAWHFYLGARSKMTRRAKAVILSMVVMGILCVIASSSRGAVVGLLASGAWLWVHSKRVVKAGLGLAVVLAIGWAILPAEQKARFQSVGEDRTSLERKTYWENGLDIARNHPVLGVGYENWMRYYAAYYRQSEVSNKYNIHTVQVPHNIFIQCAAELGYTGLVVFVALIFATFWINKRTRDLARAGPDPPDAFLFHMAMALDEAMIGYLVAGLFVTVLYYPFFWVNLAMSVALSGVAASRLRRPAASRRHYRPVAVLQPVLPPVTP